MNFQAIVSSILICFGCFGALSAQALIKSPAAKQAIAKYDESVKRLNGLHRKARISLVEQYQLEAAKLKQNLVEKLEIAKKEQTQAANLDEAVAVRNHIQRLQAKRVTAPGTSEETRELQLRASKLKAELKELKSKQRDSPLENIPREAVEFDNHHYWVVSEREGFVRAMFRCQQMGGHLLRIDSQKEHNFVRALIEKHPRGNFWVDGSDLLEEGVWRYSNTEKMPYLNWALREPNGNRGENFAEMGAGVGRKMNDVAIHGRANYFICEWGQ